MSTTNITIQRARLDLKDIIVSKTRDIYRQIGKPQPNFDNDEEWVLNFSEMDRGLKGFEVTLTDLDGFNFKAMLTKIIITLDSNLFFHDDEEMENEHHYGELRIDDLAEISEYIELLWHRICDK